MFRKLRLNKSLLISIASGFFLLYSMFHQDLLKEISNQFINLTLPIRDVLFKCIKLKSNFKQLVHIKDENAKLRLQITELQLEIQRIKQNQNFYKKLVRHIKFFSNIDQNNIEQVIGFENRIFSSSLIISMNNKKFETGQVVVAISGLVGIIINTSSKLALVKTVSDSRFSVPVKSKSGVHLILKGQNQNKMVSDAVKQSISLSHLEKNDILYTSGEGGLFQPGIPVAKVMSVNLNKNKIEAIPIVDFENLEFVSVRSLFTLP